jgi:hypothetical protein
LQNFRIIRITNYFLTVNLVHRVHVFVDRPGVLGPPWTDAGADRGHGGTLTRSWPSAAPVRQSSPAGAQQREGNAGNSEGGSSRHGQRCGGRVTAVQNRKRRHSVEAVLERGEKRREGRVRCGVTRGWCSPFIGVGGARGGNAGE